MYKRNRFKLLYSNFELVLAVLYFCLSYFELIINFKMPQEFQVLQCYLCNTFQVDIVKKQIKWSCKMCGEKQSVKKIFYRGIGKECRLYVQELNEKRIRSEQIPNKVESHTFLVTERQFESKRLDRNRSKWCEFMKNDVENTNFVDCEIQSREIKYTMNSGSNQPDRKKEKDRGAEVEQKIKNSIIPLDIFNFKNNEDIDSILEI